MRLATSGTDGAVYPAGHRVRVAIAGHDASCFSRYGPAEETFTLRLGRDSHLDLPVRYGRTGHGRVRDREMPPGNAGNWRILGCMRYPDGEDGEDAINAVLHGIKAWAEHPGARRVTAETLAELASQSRVSRVGRVRLPAPASPSRSLAEMLPEALGSIEARGTGEITGVPTGFAELDGLTSGLHPGTLTVIGGGPSVGKSALVLDLCRSASIRHKLPAILFSLEMTAAEISMRLLSAESRVPVHLMRTGQMTDDNRARLTERMAEIAGVPFYISESAALSINALSDEAARLVAGKGVRLVAVDYLQLITTGRRFESREREVAEIAQQLKALALDLQVPVVVAAQLNRGPEQRADKRPLLADLRDSDAIAQAADLVVLLHREDAFERESPRAGEADFIVAKHRNGPTATVTVAFQGHYSRFVDMASD